MAKRKRIKGLTIICKTLQHEPHTYRGWTHVLWKGNQFLLYYWHSLGFRTLSPYIWVLFTTYIFVFVSVPEWSESNLYHCVLFAPFWISGVRVTRSLLLYVMFCRSLFVPLSFFLWPLCYLFFFDLRILITPLVSSNSS